VVVDFPDLVAGVNRSDSRIPQAWERSIEGCLDGGIDCRLGFLSMAFGVEADLLGNGQRDRLVAGGSSDVVVGLAGVFEAGCQTALVALARELAEADERHPATFEICLPTRIHSRDVVEFGIGVTGVAAGVVAVSDVVQCLLGGALGCRASRSDADVVRHLGLPNRPASSFAAVRHDAKEKPME